jgi:cytochrome c biogenesis protein CcmG, thiol:disulfide interchange protein DsbE
MRRVLSPVPVAILCVVLALVALLAYGLSQNEPDRSVEDALARGELEQAPALELPKLSGDGRGSLADYRGDVVVLNFWASWCEPCREESPLLQRWHMRMAGRGGTVLGVDVLDVTGDAEDFIDEYGLSYPMLKDKAGDALESFGVVAYPETFVIDRDGRIRAVRRGPVDEAFMRTKVAPLLEET